MVFPAPIRAFVAEKLIESLDADEASPLSPEWKATIERRCREIDQEMATLIGDKEAFETAYNE